MHSPQPPSKVILRGDKCYYQTFKPTLCFACGVHLPQYYVIKNAIILSSTQEGLPLVKKKNHLEGWV